MGKKDFSEITVTELVKRAGVSRSTYYRCYGSLNDIADEIIDEIRQIAVHYLERILYNPYQAYLEMFTEFAKRRYIVQSLVKSRVTLDKIMEMPSFVSNFSSVCDTVEEYYRHIACEGACVHILKEWFLSGMKQSPEEMARLCTEIIPINIKARQ
ncbi:MAG: TetR/AcrR family transcriptional regulator [Oscillospiraceae bacterium]|nr:TetR/AcrR family transcriptional regulator [Oscillospiraceae bacterium]